MGRVGRRSPFRHSYPTLPTRNPNLEGASHPADQFGAGNAMLVAEFLELFEIERLGENSRRLLGGLRVTRAIQEVDHPLPANGHTSKPNLSAERAMVSLSATAICPPAGAPSATVPQERGCVFPTDGQPQYRLAGRRVSRPVYQLASIHGLQPASTGDGRWR